jgi:hypothetical protein
MTCGVREDPPPVGVNVKQRGAEVENLLLSLIKVKHIDVQMKLLRMRRVRPLRRLVPSRAGTRAPDQNPCEGSQTPH